MIGKTIPLCVVILLIVLSMPKAMAQPPSPPCAFYGYVYVGGKPTPDGLNVTAVIRGTTLKWTTDTNSGTYGWPLKGSNLLTIPSDDPQTPEKDGGVNGDIVEFYVNGTKADQTGRFESASAKQVDLSILGPPPKEEETPKPEETPPKPTEGTPSTPETWYVAIATGIGLGIGIGSVALVSAYLLKRRPETPKIKKKKKPKASKIKKKRRSKAPRLQ